MKSGFLLKMAFVALIIGSSVCSGEAVTKKRPTSRAKARTTARTTSLPKVVAGAEHDYGEDLKTQEFTIKKGESVISIEYPVGGNPALVEELKKYIADNVSITGANGQKIVYKFGAVETPEAFLQKAIKPYRSKGSFGMDGETIEQKISVAYNNDFIVTLQNSGYLYTGGAHGMPWTAGTTFLRTDGSKLTYKMLPSFGTLKSDIEAALAKDLEMSVSELRDMTGGGVNEYPDGEDVTPYIDADGVVIQYGAYEIGPFSMGLPKAVLKKDKVRTHCMRNALKFFN